MLADTGNCPICDSKTPTHCRQTVSATQGGKPAQVRRVYCPACDSAFEFTHADCGAGVLELVEARRLEPGDEAMQTLRRRHAHMTENAVAAR